MKSSTESAQAAVDAVSEEYDAFLQWTQRIGGSVVVKLIDNVTKRSDAFREKHESLRAELKVTTPANDDLVSAQRALLRMWGVTLALWLAVLLGVGGTCLYLGQRGGSPQSLETLPETWVWVYENWYWVVLGLAGAAWPCCGGRITPTTGRTSGTSGPSRARRTHECVRRRMLSTPGRKPLDCVI